MPPGFKRIRHYGLLSPAHKRERLARARQALQVPAPSPLAIEAAEAFMQRVAQKDISRCPCCKFGKMRIIAELPPDRSVVVPTSRAVAAPHLPESAVMATGSWAFSKKWCLLARDTLVLNRAKQVDRARLRKIKCRDRNVAHACFRPITSSVSVVSDFVANGYQTMQHVSTSPPAIPDGQISRVRF